MRVNLGYFNLFLILFYLLINLQTLSLKGWVDIDEETSVKAYHVFSLIFIPGFLLSIKKTIPKVPNFILHYFGGTVLISLVLYFIYPFNRIIINYAFAFYIFYIGYYIATIFDEDKIIEILQKITLYIFSVASVKPIYHIPQLIAFFKAPWGHPDVFTIYGGGVNLEATWLSLSSALFINSRKHFLFFVSAALLISILYASRAGVVISILVSGLYFLSPATTSKERRMLLVGASFCIFAFTFFIDFSQLAKDIYALKRIVDVGGDADKGMAGRFALWRYYYDALVNSSFMGYGAGNGIYAVESVSKIDYPEDNLHNLYMQILIETGIIGLILYMLLIYNLVIKAIRTRFLNPFAIIIIVYFIAALIQFRGTEAIIWFYIGLFLKIQTLTSQVNGS